MQTNISYLTLLIGDEKGSFRSTHVKTDIKQRFKVVRKEKDVCRGPRPYPLPLRPLMLVFN